MKRLARKSWEESKLLWRVAFPAVLTEVFQFSIGFVTASFVGHIGVVELAAVTAVESILEGFAYGVLFGMGCALDTLCGQAVGAGHLDMLGVYVQQSWIVCGAAAAALAPVYALATPILRSLLRQPAAVADAAGPYARWAAPRLLAHAANFPLQKFFQTQSKVWALALISAVGLGAHVALTYVAVRRLGCGLRGAAVAGNVSYWLIDAAQLAYLLSGRFPDAWKGFSVDAFKNLAAFVKLSLVSAIMVCLEFWYYAALLILVGLLKNGQLQLDIMSVCINYEFWIMMVALGFSEAVSVRVSNELGAGRPKSAKFAVAVAATTTAFIGAIFMAVFFIWRSSLPRVFSENEEVIQGAARMGYLLAVTVFFVSIGPVLSGVAVGAGWQLLVAFVNIGCYYLVGIPAGVLFGFKFKLGALGIWMGMLTGTLLQMTILLCIIKRTQWEKQQFLPVNGT
ncbi:protein DETOXIFICATION 29 isoform X2 [Brachypodium distachyon]|uniref:protein DETOXIFICATION 29 isoform X2 n=1 Tax=Brachypodium distachyon TaxID=15368 RepID=UPI0005300954|nr:protein DETOXIFICATION 29 isoform X2 [Brachypodium distachyon]|eukprot:XP_024316164.1 protein DETOXIFICATION 29 isoform X2 [Brachypodium distachyon]